MTLVWHLFVLALFQGCSHLNHSDLNQKSDYEASYRALLQSDIHRARRDFPNKKEQGGFITTLERAWLDFAAGEGSVKELRKLSTQLEARKTQQISSDVKTFFYKQSDDEYYPAEHEVVFLHALTAMIYAAKQQREEAMVETRRAARYLQNQFNTSHSFDDPALRLILAALWIYCGEWSSARVDLRVAGKLTNNPDLVALSQERTAPEYVGLNLLGIGPHVEWTPQVKSKVLDGLRQVSFVFPRSGEVMARPKAKNQVLVSTENWYKQHQDREFLLRDVVKSSRYAIDTTAHTAASTMTMTLGATAAVATVGLGFGLGWLVAKGLADGPGTLLLSSTTGFSLIGGGYILKESYQESKKIFAEGSDTSRYYRFVRFLPSNVQFYWNTTAADTLVDKYYQKSYKILDVKTPNASSKVAIHYLPRSDDLEFAGLYQVIHADQVMDFSNAEEYCESRSFDMLNERSFNDKLADLITNEMVAGSFEHQAIWAIDETSRDGSCWIKSPQHSRLQRASCAEQYPVICIRSKREETP